ncbi:response regulator [Benzoatithermus flavus]|uniref:histidine kinase n=1 Tax=Benzoatithermus flavus TaxID=3108223 RepID=A0ABU8XKV4_9PROT
MDEDGDESGQGAPGRNPQLQARTRSAGVDDRREPEATTARNRELEAACATLAERCRAAEEALHRSEEHRRLLAQAIEGVIYDLDLSTSQARHSEGLLDLVGIRPDEAPSSPEWWMRLIHPEDLPMVEQATRAFLSGSAEQMALEYRVRHRDGHWIHVWDRSSMLRDPDGRPLRLVGVVTDITDRKQAEEALRESEVRFRCAIEEAPIPVMMYAETGELLAMSRTVTQITGYSREELTDLDAWLRLAYGERADEIREIVRAHFEKRSAFPEAEFVIRTASGEERTWQFTAGKPDRLADGRRYTVAFAMDVTERKQAERTCQQAKEAAERANAAKSRFLAAASHDLRQPLQALDLQRAILARKIADPELLETLRELGLSIDVMRNTLDTLLDLSQLETGAIRPEIREFDLEGLFQRIGSEFRQLAAAKRLELTVVPTSVIVRSDPRLLERVLQNLVSNAIKYTRAGRILLGCRHRGGKARIEVWDTGIGIAKDQIEAIFEEFYQVANPARERRFGLGLGLSIAQAAAELLGSRLSVRSTVGKGSVFSLEVPLVRRAEPGEPLPRGSRASADVENLSATILLVEDDAAICGGLRALLELEGYAVTAVAGGREALALVEQGICRPGLVIADQNLPGDLSGVETVRRLRRLLGSRHLPALIVTGDVLPEHLAAIRLAALPYLTKPVDPNELQIVIRSLIGRSAGTAAIRAAVPRSRSESTIRSIGPSVFIVEDHPAQARSLRNLLAMAGHPAAIFASAEEFLRAYRPGTPACLIVDIHLPGMSGLELQRELTRRGDGPPCIFITGRGELAQVVQAMREGAADFLIKPVGGEELLASVNRALEHVRSPETVDTLEAADPLSRLTAREREVVELVAAGLPNKEVAYRLGISQRTVEGHRARAMHKLEIRTLAELVRLLLASGPGVRQDIV